MRQLFSHEVASRTKYDDRHPEAWLETTTNCLVDRCHGLEPLLEWVAKRQLNKVEPHDVAGADAGMLSSVALSGNLWGYPNLTFSGTGQAKEFHKVARLYGLEA